MTETFQPTISAAEQHLADWQKWNRENERQRLASMPKRAPVKPINREIDPDLADLAQELAGSSKYSQLPGMIEHLKTIKGNSYIYPGNGVIDPHRRQCDEIFELVKKAVGDARAVLETSEKLVSALNKEVQSNK